MLKEIFALSKLYIKSAFGAGTNSSSKKKKKGKGMIILFIFLGIYFVGLAAFLTVQICNVCDAINQQQVAAILPIFLVFGFAIFSTIISSVNVLFFAKDNEYILPLPVKVESIVSAKLNNLLFYDYIYTFFIGLVPLVTYGIFFNQGVLFFINALIMMLITPILPTIIITFIMIVIMSFSKKAKSKGIFQIVGLLFGLCLGFGISLFFQNMNPERALEFVAQANGLVEQIKNIFFVFKWSVEVLVDNNYLSLLLLLGFNAVIYLIYIFVSRKLYLKGAVGALNSGVSTKHKFKSESREYSSQGVMKSYILKEFRTLFRKPIYLTQCVLPSVLLPIIMVVATYFSINAKSTQSGMDVNKLKELMKLEMADKPVFAILTLFVMFSSMFVFVSISAVSRDGENAVFMKYAPLKASTQIIAKAAPDAIFTLFNGIICCILGFALFGVKPQIILYVLVLIIPYSVCHSLANILIDLHRPKLHWVNELEAVKNNFNTLFTVCFALVACLLIVPVFFIGDVGTWAVGYTIFYAVVGRVLITYINKKDSLLLDKIY